jgi:quinol monooxygenase YgiN
MLEDCCDARRRASINRRFTLFSTSSIHMHTKRRALVAAIAAVPLAGCQSIPIPAKEQNTMYGLIGKIKTIPGQRDALAAILLEATRAMPGCLSYIVASDPQDADALWITEAWDSPDSHKASLGLPAVKAALAAGRPLIAGFGERFETRPIGGAGLHTP